MRLIALILFFHTSSLLAVTEVSSPAIESVEQGRKAPDFTPPKDLSGPTFPAEDFINNPPPENNKFLVEFVKMSATLGLVIALILIVAWFLKRIVNTRLEQGNNTSSINVIEKRAISQKTMVYLLDVEGKGIVLAEGHNGVTFLGNFRVQDEEGDEEKLPTSFSKLLDK